MDAMQTHYICASCFEVGEMRKTTRAHEVRQKVYPNVYLSRRFINMCCEKWTSAKKKKSK